MYKLLRRISSTFKERFDWTRENGEDGATSNSTPQTGNKRRMSDDDDEVPNGSLSKRSRGVHDEDYIDASELGEVKRGDEYENEADESTQSREETRPREETEDVRRVRKGVKEVDLEDKKGKGKKPVEDDSSSAEEGDEPEKIAGKHEDPPPSEETKAVETEATKKVAEDESTPDTAEISESSKEDDVLVPASEDVDAQGELDVPSENEAVSDAPAHADIASTEATEPSLASASTTTTTATSTLPSKEVVYKPETISEPLPAIAASEAPVKVHG